MQIMFVSIGTKITHFLHFGTFFPRNNMSSQPFVHFAFKGGYSCSFKSVSMRVPPKLFHFLLQIQTDRSIIVGVLTSYSVLFRNETKLSPTNGHFSSLKFLQQIPLFLLELGISILLTLTAYDIVHTMLKRWAVPHVFGYRIVHPSS